MDRSKWEYKKLCDVALITMGQSPSSESYNEEGRGLPFYQGNADFGVLHPKARVYCDAPQREAYENDILMSVRAPIGAINIANTHCCIGRGLCAIRPKERTLELKYLYYYLISKNGYLNQQGTGSTFKSISKKTVFDLSIPVPSLASQQRIASEIDCLNEMIALKQEQLKEFDKLAQSIFHDMFGDSVINSKGWPTDKIENVISEKSYRGTINNEDGQVWLLNLDMVESNTGRILEKLFVSTEKTDGSVTTFNEEYVLYSKLRPYLNKVVLPDSSGYCTTELVTLLPNKDKLNRYYVAYLLRSESFVNYICGKVAGAKMPRVSMKEFRIFSIPLPPLALQQQFAEKIQAIEAQKELVKKSIAETQHLLDSRMDYYFD